MRKHPLIALMLLSGGISILGVDVRAFADEREHRGAQSPWKPQFASRRDRAGQQGGNNGGNGGGGGNSNNGGGNNGNGGGGNNSGGGNGGGGGGGGGSSAYKPRMQDKIYDGAQKGAEPYQKKEEEAGKAFSTELAKMNQDFSKQLEKAKIPESDALLKEIAKESTDVTQLTGIAKDAVNAEIADQKTLGDTISKGYMVMAQAYANMPVVTPSPTPYAPSVGEEIAALTANRPHGGGSVASAFDGSGKTSPLQMIRGPGAQLGNGEHANFGAQRGPASVMGFPAGSVYNRPK